MAGVLQYRTLAQKNASFVVTNTGRATMPLIVNNVADEDREYSIELLPSRNNPADLTRMEVGICLEKPLYEIWQKGGCSAEKILHHDAESRTLYLQGYDSKIGELRLPKDNKKQLRMICSCSVLANEDIKEEKRYEYDIVQRDLQTGQIVGGEHFSIVQKPRKGIFPAIKSLMTSEGYELEAVGVEEDADYFWLNDKGYVMAMGQTVRIVPQLNDKHILLKVKAKSDGAINYAVLSLDPHLTIKEVSPNPFKTSLTITLSEPVPEGTVISMSPIGAVGSSERYKVRSGERRLTISNADCVAGIYVIVLQVNGTVVDTRSVICK